MAKKTKNKPLWHPLVWPAWIVVFLLYLLSRLTLPAAQRVGERLGRFAYRKWRSRRKVALRNLELCFPEMTEAEREALVEANFVALMRGVLETVHSWWRDVNPYLNNTHYLGLDNLAAAQAEGKGVLLLGGHYAIFDLALPMIASVLDRPGYMYRPNDNPVIDHMIESGRRRHFNIRSFGKRETLSMVRYLKQGGEVWYACDQDFGRHAQLFVPFFGVPACVIDAPSRIARDSGCNVVCVSHLRRPDGSYEVAFSPMLKNAGENPQADAEVWNQFLEDAVRRYPDQYLWLHKRFKTRPEGAPKIY